MLLVAVFAALSSGPASGGLAAENAQKFDDPALTHPLGGLGDVLFSPLARWDAVWYLRVAGSGYGGERRAGRLLPALPAAGPRAGRARRGVGGALLIAAYLVSLAAFLAALALLHRWPRSSSGGRWPPPTLWLLAVFPGALFFGAPYSESLFLLCRWPPSTRARTGRWARAGAAAAGGAATRSAGLVLLLPLALIWWWQSRPRRAARRAPGSCSCRSAPRRTRATWAWPRATPCASSTSRTPGRGTSPGPSWAPGTGSRAAVDGVRQLGSGQRTHVYFEQAGGDPYRVAALNIMLFGFLVFAVVAAVGVWRRLPRPYGVYMVAALALPLSFPVGPQPLMSLPRFLAVLFPVFMWLAVVCEERRLTQPALVVSAIGLGLFTTQFATWHFIA